MATYVFSLGLIPVQEWIAQARRSRDLRAGSAFLCHLMARTLAALAQEGAEILLPREPPGISFAALADLRQALAAPYGIPNRASGYLDAADREDAARRLDATTHSALCAAWDGFRNDFLRPSGKAGPWEVDFWRRLAEPLAAYRRATPEGEDCPFSFVWAALPAPFPREDRKGNLRAVERLYGDVKRTRPVRPALPGHAIGKCNQCGAREAIGPTGSFESWRDWYRELGRDLPWVARGIRFDAGERLCYVCLAKRAAGYAEGLSFPSTGDVAARPWIARAESDAELAEKLERLRKTEAGRADLARALRGSKRELAGLLAQDAYKIQEEIREHIRANPKLGLTEIPPGYLALLVFDGDDMGRRVREDPEGVPIAMAEFAGRARELMGEHRGEIFYLAGDEGLAMAPAESALALALALRKAFGAAFGEEITLSLGIAYFEHSRPMAGAIRAARAVLEKAKALDIGGQRKDGLGVTVATASGNLWSLAERWGPFWDRLGRAAALVREGRLSSGWAYDVEAFLGTIDEGAWGREPGLPAAVRDEARRLFSRRFRAAGDTAEARRADTKTTWHEELRGDSWWETPPGERPRPLPEQLHLIGFLGRQRSISETQAAPPAVPAEAPAR